MSNTQNMNIPFEPIEGGKPSAFDAGNNLQDWAPLTDAAGNPVEPGADGQLPLLPSQYVRLRTPKSQMIYKLNVTPELVSVSAPEQLN